MKNEHGKCLVLYGGESGEREVSLRSGVACAKALLEAGIDVELFDWKPERVRELLALDIQRAFIALHGGSGEDGSLQACLKIAGISYTGCHTRAMANAMDKHISKVIIRQSTDLRVPEAFAFDVGTAREMLAKSSAGVWDEIVETLGLPFIVKPARSGSSLGVSIVKTVDAIDAAVHLACIDDADLVMFEAYIKGPELTVAVLNGKAIGVCQIVVTGEFYDYEAKYMRNDTQYLTPSRLGDDFDQALCIQAEAAAKALECVDGCVRVDFLVDRDLKAYFLEINTVPGMTEKSLVPKIAEKHGISFPQLCKRIWEE